MVGLPGGLSGADFEDFYTAKHFRDYDIVIVDPNGALKGKEHNYTLNIHDGLLELDHEVGGSFHNRFNEIRNKLTEYVNKGGVALLFHRHMPTLRYKSSFDGVTRVDYLDLDGTEKSVRRAHGNNIEFANTSPFNEFWKATVNCWKYEAIFNETPNKNVLANVKGDVEEVVSKYIETTARGFSRCGPNTGFMESIK